MHKKNLLSILLFFLLAPILQITYAGINPQEQLRQLKSTCACPNCDLSFSNLKGFNPGSSNPKLNPFANGSKTNPPNCWLTCNLNQANLSHANLSQSNFTTCIRGYVTPLARASFENANLSYAILTDSIFIGVDFTKANFTYAVLTGSQLNLSIFKNANFNHSDLSKTNSPRDAMHGWGSDFSNANFTYANLTHADLYGNFQGANFSYANLVNAKITSARDAFNVVIKNPAELWQGVNFSYADLRHAEIKNTEGSADLSQAHFCHTKMPDGTENNRDCDASIAKQSR